MAVRNLVALEEQSTVPRMEELWESRGRTTNGLACFLWETTPWVNHSLNPGSCSQKQLTQKLFLPNGSPEAQQDLEGLSDPRRVFHRKWEDL